MHQRLSHNDKPCVYKIPCKDCDKVFVGQTGRNLNTRNVEHKRSVRYAQENSALFQHMQNVGHVIDWNNSTMLFKSNCSFSSKIVESCYIDSLPNLNISGGQWNLDPVLGKAIKKIIHISPFGRGAGHVT